MAILQRKSAAQYWRSLINHWLVVLPALLIVAALGMRQINLYPPTPDEFYSMFNSGWLGQGPYSPADVIASLHEYSPNHTPGYFVLLSIWGNWVSYDIAIGRVFGVYCALLTLTITYRIARDFISPTAAFFAILILFSNAFLNFYVAHARMYMLLTMFAGAAIWFYLRLAHSARSPNRSDYVAFGSTAFGLLCAHAFGAVVALTLAIYHLLFAPKNRHWLALAVAAAAATICAAPFYFVIATEGVSRSLRDWSAAAQSLADTLFALLLLITNGQPLLLALGLAGLALAAIFRRRLPQPLIRLAIIQIVLIIALAQFTDFIIITNFRYLLPTWLVFSLLMAAGLYHLGRWRTVAGALILLWFIAGLAFQRAADWRAYIAGRNFAFRHAPWQVLPELADDSQPSPRIYYVSTEWSHLDFAVRIPISQKQHYFDRHDLRISTPKTLEEMAHTVSENTIIQPEYWALYNQAEQLPEAVGALIARMNSLNYNLCDEIPIGATWQLLDFSWDTLACQDFSPPTQASNDLLSHNFYNARLPADRAELVFSDSWSARTDLTLDNFAFSYQLISQDWDNVAQLDLPLVHEGSLRRFTIDISDAPADAYRLMLILYDKRTGQKVDWHDNPGYQPAMLQLAEIVLE